MNREQFEWRIRFASYEKVRGMIPQSLDHPDSTYECEEEYRLEESVEWSRNRIKTYVLTYSYGEEILQVAKADSKKECCINMLLRLFDDWRLPKYTDNNLLPEQKDG